MPVYEFEPIGEETCPYCSGGFEVERSYADEKAAPTVECPCCGAPAKRRISRFSVSTGFANKAPSHQRLAQHGFSVLENQGNGTYKKIN